MPPSGTLKRRPSSSAGWTRPVREAQRILFALAAFWALLSVPLFVAQYAVGLPVFDESGPVLHAREMVLGFLLPVITGYLRPRLGLAWLAAFVAAWAAGRGSAFAGPDALRSLADVLQGLAFVAAVVPMLARGAKKWRNRALPVLLAVLGLTAAGFLAAARFGPGSYRALVDVLLASLGLLLLFMGGRILVPLFRGHATRHGMPRPPGLQPAVEGALIGLGFATVLALGLGWRLAAAPGALALAALGLWRMVRWRPWRYAARPELLALLAGQLWTVAALVVLAIAWLEGRPAGTASIHVLTIGGAGTMTATVMAFALLKGGAGGFVQRFWLPLGVSLMAASLLLRLAADADPPAAGLWLTLSAACWSAAWLGVLMLTFSRRVSRAGL